MKKDNRCDAHKKQYRDNELLSPCRARCNICKKKKINGYSNPDHVSNPFGYLYLFPEICDSCSEETHLCIWCNVCK